MADEKYPKYLYRDGITQEVTSAQDEAYFRALGYTDPKPAAKPAAKAETPPMVEPPAETPSKKAGGKA